MLLNFVDKSFDVKRLTHYRLSIQISLNGFSFCVFDQSLSKHIILRHYQYNKNIINYDDLISEVETILASDAYLALKYPNCSCIYISPKHTLIPDKLFVEDKLRSYLEFVSPLDELDEIHYYNFFKTDVYSIFIVPSPIASRLISSYGKIRFLNQSYLLIHSCLKGTESSSVYINLHEGMANIALCHNKQFKLHNSFEIFHLNDAVFYLNALLSQFNIKPQSIPVFISGDILREEIDELTKFFPLLKINNNHRMSMLIGSENSYRYYNLLMVHECE